MTDDVKTQDGHIDRRKRAEQVAQTRRDILAAAGALFRADGYTAVAMPAIAREAGVAVETIYRAFGSKAGLFAAVIDAAVAGGAPERSGRSRTAPRSERSSRNRIRAARSSATPRPSPASTADPDHFSGRFPRRRTDPELRPCGTRSKRAGSKGRAGSSRCSPSGSSSTGLSIEAGRDGLWTLTSLAVYDMLVGSRSWSVERYERWLADRLTDFLLG